MALRKTTASPPVPEDLRHRGRATEDLVAALRDADPEARRRSALDLTGNAAAVPALLDAVGPETDLAVRDALLTTLVGFDEPATVRALLVHLRSEDPGLRNAVVGALHTMPVGVAAVVDEVLADPDHDVRTLMVMVLAELPHPAVVEWLSGLVESDPHANVVAAAVDAVMSVDAAAGRTLARTAEARFPDDPFLHFLTGSFSPGER